MAALICTLGLLVPSLFLMRLLDAHWPKPPMVSAVIALVGLLLCRAVNPGLGIDVMAIGLGVVVGYFAGSERSRWAVSLVPGTLVAAVFLLFTETGLSGNSQLDSRPNPLLVALLLNALVLVSWAAISAAWRLGASLPPQRAGDPQATR